MSKTAWFAGLAITYDAEDSTVLHGPLVDEAALHGVLIKVRDLARPGLSVNRVTEGGAEPESQETWRVCRCANDDRITAHMSL